MRDTSGHTSRTPFAFFDLEESCWKTSQGTLVSDLDTFSETWPGSGMTLDGYAYELPMQEHLTTDAEYSLLPTPTASMMDKDEIEDFVQGSIELGMVKTVSLGLAIRSGMTKSQLTRLLPTPQATDDKRCKAKPANHRPDAQETLGRALGHILQQSNNGQEYSEDQHLFL